MYFKGGVEQLKLMAAYTEGSQDSAYGEISPYSLPEWAQKLKIKPCYRCRLCMRPTPIHKWALPGVPSEFQVSVKREDLTGSTLTGNKVRKLEFLLADAVQQGCDTIVTFGGPQSNHSRATALAARQLGLQTYIFVAHVEGHETVETSTHGNVLLSKLAGAKFVAFPVKNNYVDNAVYIQGKMTEFAKRLSTEGHKVYSMPSGGSSTLGIWGYVDAFDEMMKQGLLESFDDIVAPAGSIGMVASLAIANYLTGSHVKIHAVSIAPVLTDEIIFDKIKKYLIDLDLDDNVKPQELIAPPIVDYGGIGYSVSTDEELETVVEITSATGVPLDIDYGVKAVRGMIGEMHKNPGRFAGKRVLYMHTGGIYNLFDGRIDHIIRRNVVTSQVDIQI